MLSVDTLVDDASVGKYHGDADVLLMGNKSTFTPTTASSPPVAISHPVLSWRALPLLQMEPGSTTYCCATSRGR